MLTSILIFQHRPPEILSDLWSHIGLYLEAHLEDPLRCAEWCMDVGLMKSAMECRRHRTPRTLRLRPDHGSPAWFCRRCNDRKSATVGTIFEDHNIPISQVLLPAMSFAHKYTYRQTRHACIVSRGETPLTDRTIAHWFGLFRDCVVDSATSLSGEGGLIGGTGVTVQIEEALIGRRKFQRRRIVPGTWVIRMIASTGDMRLET